MDILIVLIMAADTTVDIMVVVHFVVITEDIEDIKMASNCNICSEKCMGFAANHGGCCTIADRDFIIGPHFDTDEFLDRLSEKFGRNFEFDDVFYSYEKGKNVLQSKSTWQNPDSFPALKVDFFNPKLPCIFYNTTIKACSIYDIRPQTCRDYECSYLTQNT
jgi:Fe-S-cluster containining protein